MKKRIVAALMMVALCMSTAMEAGAAALDSGFAADFEAEAEAPAEEPVPEENVSEPPAAEAPVEDVPAIEAPVIEEPMEQEGFEDGFVSAEEPDMETEAPAEPMVDGFAAEETESKETEAEPQEAECWKWDGTKFCYYGKDGKALTMAQVEALFKELEIYKGYYEIDGEYYSLDANGVPRTGDITLTVNNVKANYFFSPDRDKEGRYGKMFRDGWRSVQTSKGEQWLYYDSGEQNPTKMGQLYVHGTIPTELDNLKGEYTYLIDKNGYILKKRMVKAADGSYYATDANGRVCKNKFYYYKKQTFYFGPTGAKVAWKNGWYRCPGANNRMYYFGSKPGRVVRKTGWQKVTKKGKYYGWFFFDRKGVHYTDKLTSSGRYFRPDGRLASGVALMKGKCYFFEPSTYKGFKGQMVKNRIITYKGKTYYASKGGMLRQKGWQKLDGSYYYLKDMRIVKNTFIKKGNTYGYLDGTGRFTTGWVIENDAKNLVRYLNPDKKGFVTNTSRWINGKLYYFDENGYRINDLTSRYTSGYSLTVDRVNGVMTVYAENGTVPVKSIRVSVGLSSTPTPTGTYYLSRGGRWQSLMGPSWGQYASHVDGAGQGGIFVHSVACSQANSYNLPVGAYNMLGNPASHGCIRTCVADAKWVYTHCAGSRITIFDGSYNSREALKGPLGRRALVAVRPPKNGGYYDPTDVEA